MTTNQDRSAPTREIEISEWITHARNTCRGFFTATLPSGMMLRDLSLHENDKGRWIKMPSRAWTDNNGDTQYTPIIQFTDSETRDSFRDAVLAALDRHLAERARRQKQ